MTDNTSSSELHHGTAIAVGNRAVLLRGPSGSGKSDLALRCLNTTIQTNLTPGAALQTPVLIGDDYVRIDREGKRLVVTAPETIHGKLEVRGVGLIHVATAPKAYLELIIDLTTSDLVQRLPSPWPNSDILSVAVPTLQLAPFEDSTPIKILLALSDQAEAGLRS